MDVVLREFKTTDTEELNSTVIKAFNQYSSQFNEWEIFSKRIGSMSSLANESEIIIAELDNHVSGAVAYYAPGRDTTDYFPEQWASIRMLVVDPSYRGKGLGRALMDESIHRARKDSAQAIGLHTSSIMEVALSMYLRLGFKKIKSIPDIHGVPYSLYKLEL